MIIDESTGLPQVPEGFYWKVRYTLPGNGTFDEWRTILNVALVKREPKWYNKDRVVPIQSRKISLQDGERYFRNSYGGQQPILIDPEDRDYSELVLEQATMIYKAHQVQLKSIDIKRRAVSALQKVSGDYPPKKLEIDSEG